MLVDLEAERALLGSCLLAGDAGTVARVGAIARPEDFSAPALAVVFEAFEAIAARGEPLDVLTAAQELRRMERLNTVGGSQFLGELTDTIPTVAHIESHAAIVAGLGRQRRAAEAARELHARLAGGEPVESALARFQAAATAGVVRRDLTARRAVDEAWERLESGATARALYGLATFDGGPGVARPLFGGLFGAQLTVCAAIPGGGKSVLALGAALATAEAGGRALVFSLEMPRDEFVWRGAARHWPAGEAPPSIDRIRSRRLSADECAELGRATQRIADLDGLLIDESRHTVDSLTILARAEHARAPVSLVVVDYLQLLGRDAVDGRAREDEVLRRQAYQLKGLAKELGCAVLALAQFNRGGAKSERPTMFDLLGGSGIEQAADNVVILAPEDEGDAEVVRVRVCSDKRRGGAVEKGGRIVLLDKPRQRFCDPVDDYESWTPSGAGARDARGWDGYTAPGGEAE